MRETASALESGAHDVSKTCSIVGIDARSLQLSGSTTSCARARSSGRGTSAAMFAREAGVHARSADASQAIPHTVPLLTSSQRTLSRDGVCVWSHSRIDDTVTCNDAHVSSHRHAPCDHDRRGDDMTELKEKQRKSMPKKVFAYVDRDGEGHLPLNDESHIRNAMARWNQTTFPSPTAREAARRK